MTKKLLISVAVAALLVAASGGAFAAGVVASSRTSQTLSDLQRAVQRLRTPVPSGVAPYLLQHFSVFRRVQESHPPLPARVAAVYSGAGPQAGYGLDLARTQYVAVTPTFHVWLVPGSAGVCMVYPDRIFPPPGSPPRGPALGGTCSGIGQLGAGLSVSETLPPTGEVYIPRGEQVPHETWIQLVPDGNSTVTFTERDGRVLTTPVVGNVVYGTSDVTSSSDFRKERSRNVAGVIGTRDIGGPN
jgi:hypothetical protein